MKKKFKSVIAVLLAVTMIFSVNVSAAAASEKHNYEIRTATTVFGGIIDGAFSFLDLLIPNVKVPDINDYFAEGGENFYAGTANFIDEPAEGAKWSLGFGQESLVPENLKDGSKKYYTGGYFTQKVEGVYDDQRANAIALNDGSGRGTTVFASIDGIGVGNADIRTIRAMAVEKLAAKGIKADFNAININATHCHTVCDTQGIGIDLLLRIFRNILAWLPFVELDRNINDEFLAKMLDGASDAIVEAYMNMETGKLYYFESAGIGKSEELGNYLDDEYSFLHNKRYDEEGYQHVWACFKFVPDNTASKPTVFANLGVHPTTIERSTTLLSADFPNFMEEKFAEEGMNFMFIQGAQSPISLKKSGVTTPEIIDKVDAAVAANPELAPYRNATTLGYEFARLILEAQVNAEEVEPILNVKMKEYAIPLERGLYQVGAVNGFLGITMVKDKASPTKYSVVTEAGYIEIGKDIVLLTAPGELIPQLVYGNVVSAEESYTGEEWTIPCTVDLLPEDKTVLVMGLCNDAIGYIVPDTDYAHFIADSLWSMDGMEGLYGPAKRHYEELLCTGSKAGSTTMTVINELVMSEN